MRNENAAIVDPTWVMAGLCLEAGKDLLSDGEELNVGIVRTKTPNYAG